MSGECGIYDLPLEILFHIASFDVGSYRAMLSVSRFARSLSPDKVVDFMILFGYSVEIDKYGVFWYLNGKPHRQARHGDPGGPAMEWWNGNKYWYLNGNLHRSDGPAVETEIGDKEWWRFGVRHRVDGPAIEWRNGDRYWYLNGVLHRRVIEKV
jgi:hypothetical protein